MNDAAPQRRPGTAAIAFTVLAVLVLFGLGMRRLMHSVESNAPVVRAAERLERTQRLHPVDLAWDASWTFADLEEAPWLSKVQGAVPATSVNPHSGVTVVNLWASWCEPCRAELPSMLQLARAVPEAHFIFISYDEEWDSPTQLFRQILGAMPTGVAVARDPKGQAGGEQDPQTWWRRLGATGLPETFFVKDGRVLSKVVGAIDWTAPDVHEFLSLLARQ